MKHPIIGITPRQALLVAAVFERAERSHQHDLLFAAGREVGLTRNETLLELDAIVDKARETETA